MTVAAGASEAAPAGQETWGGVPVPVKSVSSIPILAIVTLPVFVTR